MENKAFDAVVVGAGLAGIYMLHKLKGLGLTVRVYESGGGVGGTWYWNRYPGARCDIPSMEYSYQFSDELQQNWEWTERYATQPEILRYANHVVDRFDLRADIQLNTRVQAAEFDEASARWQLVLARGELATARFLVMATGCLSVPNYPNIKGLDQFPGNVYHTGTWPHDEIDFTDQRVALIGTGSSAIQSLPLIAEQAQQVTVFQRTPSYSVPAHNRPLDAAEVAAIKARYGEFRAENWQRGFGADFRDSELGAFDVDEAARQAEYEDRWARGGLAFMASFNDLMFDPAANDTARAFIANKIRQTVSDVELAQQLTPDTPVGCKRLCVDTNYYQTFNQSHVELVSLSSRSIDQIQGRELCVGDQRYEVDSIVLATGFDAMTGALSRIDIKGVNGQSLQSKWSHGPSAYLGLATAGFPNLFMITGPGSPSVLSNMLPSIEQHVEWIASCIDHMADHQWQRIDVKPEAEQSWMTHVDEVANATIYYGCNSWYLGANVDGKERVFMPYVGVPTYVEKCAQVVADGYDGFEMSAVERVG